MVFCLSPSFVRKARVGLHSAVVTKGEGCFSSTKPWRQGTLRDAQTWRSRGTLAAYDLVVVEWLRLRWPDDSFRSPAPKCTCRLAIRSAPTHDLLAARRDHLGPRARPMPRTVKRLPRPYLPLARCQPVDGFVSQHRFKRLWRYHSDPCTSRNSTLASRRRQDTNLHSLAHAALLFHAQERRPRRQVWWPLLVATLGNLDCTRMHARDIGSHSKAIPFGTS